MFDTIVKNKFNILVLALFAAIAFWGMFHHEIWRDEGQVWLVVRDLDLAGVFNHVRNEGHPLLWYMLVMPFAKLKLPVVVMQILSVVFMTAAAAVLLWKSPFDKLNKVCVIFSAGFLYWLTIISRSYSLIPLLLFLLAFCYNKQKQHPYVYCVLNMLLANTHIIMFGFCSSVAVLFGYENILKNPQDKKKYIVPFLITFVCLVVTALYILFRPETNISVEIRPWNFINLGIITEAIKLLFLNLYADTSFLAAAAGLSILGAIIFIFKENKKMFFVFACSFLYQFYIYICVFKTSPEKAFTFLLVMLFCFWVIFNQKDKNQIKKNLINYPFMFMFLLTICLSFVMVKNDLLYNYSGSKEAAEFIEKNIEKDAVIISNNPLTTAGILAYLPERKFYLPFYGDFYTFGYARDMDLTRPFEFVKPAVFKDKQVYYIYSALGKPVSDKKIIFSSNKNTLIPTEYFFILKD